jgi:hypothetical protein
MRCRNCGRTLYRSSNTSACLTIGGHICCSHVEPVPEDSFPVQRVRPPAWEEINDVRGRSRSNPDRFTPNNRWNLLTLSDVEIIVAGLALLTARNPGNLHDALTTLAHLEETTEPTSLGEDFYRLVDSYRNMEPVTTTTEPTSRPIRRIKA